jgi:hypothetical protein
VSAVRPLLAIIAALIVWSVISYALISMFAGTNVCHILQTVGPDGSVHPLTQIEMDAQVGRCNRPNFGTLVISLLGYGVIVTAALTQVMPPRTRES